MGQTFADLTTDYLGCVDDYEKYLELEKAHSGSGDDIRILGLLAAEVKDQNGIAILHQYSRRIPEVLESICSHKTSLMIVFAFSHYCWSISLQVCCDNK